MKNELGESPVEKIRESLPLEGLVGMEGKEAPLVDSGVSSIEKSKMVRPDMIPLMGVPLLAVPAHLEGVVFASSSLEGGGARSVVVATTASKFKVEEIKNAMWKAWGDSVREIGRQVRELWNSPAYLQVQEVYRKQSLASKSSAALDVRGASNRTGLLPAEREAELEPGRFFLTLLDRLQAIEQVPPTVEVSDIQAPEDTSRMLVLPLAATLLASGVLAGGMAVTHSDASGNAVQPASGIMEWVQRLTPLFPQLSPQDLMPVINLMILPPLYYRSWDEAVSRRSEERPSYVEVVRKFAEDVLKIVVHPDFLNNLLLSMPGVERLPSESRDRLACMLKVLLIGVALSLLYSVEVGKIQNDQFGGIEPEELRDLLLGKWLEEPKGKKKLEVKDQITPILVKRAREQLNLLGSGDRLEAAGMLVDYVTAKRELEPMLEPLKVFSEVMTPGSSSEALSVVRV